MSSQREKIYQKIFASNVFNTEPAKRTETSTGKKVSPLKNRDHFATLAKPPSKAVLHTGKRLTKEKSTDIFNQKKKNFTNQLSSRIKDNRKNESIVFKENTSKDYVVKRKPYISDYDPEKYLKYESAHNRKMKEIYNNTAPCSVEKKKNPIKVNVNNNKIHFKPKLKTMKTKMSNSFSTDPKINKMKMLQSNIFNSPSKEQLNNRALSQRSSTQSSSNKINSVKHSLSQTQNHYKKVSEYSEFTAKLDWKNTNTEIRFKPKKEDHSIKIIRSNNNFKSLSNKNNATESKKELKKFCNKYSYNESQAKKLADSYSTYQGGKFLKDNYIKNTKNDEYNSNEEKFEIKDIKPYQEKEIKDTFLKNGIQLYAINHSANFIGDISNSFQFKIRKDFNDKNYESKLNKVSIALRKKTGKEMKKVNSVSKGKKTISSYETYDCLSKRKPKIQIKKINVDIQKDRHAFSKEYSNVNYKYKSSMTSRK